ncbi:two-component system QseEF-associated lipoprotein QseG [Kosakonia sp. ML.JS2a]|uniref:two-component system QseEF-associated lipoprotein QseG n=1 Tax=Kosakonia sp. ML.JS2a TaxID=2980557 RepID=UPI0021D857A8|nr:two-component system QseEF-associated lipoprotein QseG [Kosakonia sp. ML.JS2a]UXY12170.1 two-component system QseEF-associated lipoprotein QseG [Kosakonia sp. ML.JS2a]
MNLDLVSMSHVFSRVMNAVSPHNKWLRAFPCLLLAGCVAQKPQSAIQDGQEERLPEHQLADFLSTDCDDIWLLSGPHVDTNPLYWLRAMDCAQRLAPAAARAEARSWTDDNWSATFRRGILLSSAKITPLERRDYTTRLDAVSPTIPAQVRPLFQLWRDSEMLQLQLSEERSRYSKLQQSTDSELDTLRQQQQFLREQLETTTRKLETLTDIERRLSTRKPAPADLPDSSRPSKSDGNQEDVKP